MPSVKNDTYRFYIGMDEVGRGPLAGPVTVCGVLWIDNQSPTYFFPKFKDSKQLSEKKRITVFNQLQKLSSQSFFYHTASVSAKVIDNIGISKALHRASCEVLQSLAKMQKPYHILADYGLPLSDEYPSTHIVRGDEKEPLISFASIIAKVTRDREMQRLAPIFPFYGLERNKGYGTQGHVRALKEHGPTDIHRKTFLKKLELHSN